MKDRKKQPTEILFDHSQRQSLLEFAETLETIAQKLKTESQFILIEGNKETKITPNEQLKVDYEYKTKGDKHSFEIEFEWYTGESKQTDFKIQ